jgi:hypothetical protein
MRVFSVFIPGYGLVFVRARSEGAAVQAARTALRTEDPNVQPQVRGVADESAMNSAAGALLIDENGRQVGTASRDANRSFLTGETAQPPAGAPTQPAAPPAVAQPQPVTDETSKALEGQPIPDELFGGQAAYGAGLAARGLNTDIGSGAFGRYLANRFNPTRAVYSAGDLLAGGSGDVGENPGAFQQYARDTGGMNLGDQALSTFRDLAGAGPGDNAYLEEFMDLAGEDRGRTAYDLAREAGRGRYGGFAASQFVPSYNRLYQGFFGGGGQVDDSGGWIDYLNRRLGLQ